MGNKHGLAIASMVLGIVSCVMFILSFTYVAPPLGLVCGIVAIVLGITARKADPNDTFATVGLVLGLVGLVLCVVTTITCTICTGCAACNTYGALSSLY